MASMLALLIRTYMLVKAAVTTAWSVVKAVLRPIAKAGAEMLMMILRVLLWIVVRVVEAVPAEKLGSAVTVTVKFLQSLVKRVGEDHPVVQQLSDFRVDDGKPLPNP